MERDLLLVAIVVVVVAFMATMYWMVESQGK